MATTFAKANREARNLRDYWAAFGHVVHVRVVVEETSSGTLIYSLASDLRAGLPPNFKSRDYQIFADETPAPNVKASRGYRGPGYARRVPAAAQ